MVVEHVKELWAVALFVNDHVQFHSFFSVAGWKHFDEAYIRAGAVCEFPTTDFCAFVGDLRLW